MDSSKLFEEYNSLLDGALKPDIYRENQDTDDEDEKNEDAKTWIPELKRVIQFNDLRGNTQVVPLEKFSRRKIKKPEAPGLFRNYALLQRKVLRLDGALQEFTLEIQSDGLQQIFKKLATSYREVNLEANPIVLTPPFRCLFFLRKDLETLSTDDSVGEATQKELQQLLEFIKSDRGIQKLIASYDSLVPTNRITFDLLWTLFPPRELVYIGSKGNTKYPFEYCAFVETTRMIGPPNQMRDLEITILLGFHNGMGYGIVAPQLYIREFFGIVDINSQNLTVIPFSKLPETKQEELKARFIERGKRYIDICTAKHSFLHYNGPIQLPESEGAKRLGKFQPAGYSYSGFTTPPGGYRVIVDKQIQDQLSNLSELKSLGPTRIVGSVQQLLESIKPSAEVTDDEIRDAGWDSIVGRNLGKEFKLEDDDYLICFPKVVAFVLQQKCWADYVHIDGLTEIAWTEDPFLSLQLSIQEKLLIKALVGNFGKDPISQSYDIIEGKGTGLIFLLHGLPGLGKTLTAESVAETTRRPLYHISTGELSTEVSSLEKQLVDIFRLGSRWGAVVLLDEADVLMQRRTAQDLHRNAIVAVFLRMLEYYNGMLFITTNRLADFDQAFQNRIHLSIAFDGLEAPARTNIWRQHISRANQKYKATKPWTEEVFESLGQLETNGRDIRNSVRTADSYAQSATEDLALRHVITVLRNNFNHQQLAAQKDAIEKLDNLAAAWV